MQLFVVVERDAAERLASALNSNAVHDWPSRPNLRIWHSSQNVLIDESGRQIDWTDIRPGDEVFLSKGVGCPVDRLTESGVSVGKFSVRQLSINSGPFQSVLRRHGLDWFDAAVDECARYTAADIDQVHVADWLDQFERLGARWLGEKLLRTIRVRQAFDLKRLLRLDRLKPDEKVRIGLLSRLGKSGGTLAHIIEKNTGCRCHDVTDSIDGCRRNRNASVELFEDGLWTGIEAQRVIHDLAVNYPDSRPGQKTRGLRYKHLLQQIPIALNFAVKTDIGVMALRAALQQQQLQNVIIRDEVGETHQVLSDSGKKRLAAVHDIFDEVKCGRLSESDVRPMVFHDSRIWTDQGQVGNAQEILTRVGKDLWINRGRPFSDWSPQRLTNAALGSNSIGSTIVFSHGSPMAALPVLWGMGPVRHGKGQLNWSPLFPADPVG